MGGVEEDSEVGVLLVGVVSSGVVGLVHHLDLFDEFLFRLIEVSASGVDYHSCGAGLGNRL